MLLEAASRNDIEEGKEKLCKSVWGSGSIRYIRHKHKGSILQRICCERDLSRHGREILHLTPGIEQRWQILNK